MRWWLHPSSAMLSSVVLLGASSSLLPMAAAAEAEAAVVDVTLVAHYEVINIDGSFLRLPLFNGTFPGPAIECVRGDTLRINVINDMKKEELSVNWQGMVQKNTNHMDGVPYLTENPIAVGGGSRVYQFEADSAGTFHYHSNQEFIRSGLHGIIVVREPDAASDPLVDAYGDYSDLVAVQQHSSSKSSSPTYYPALVATDLYHKDGATLAQQLDNGIGDWIWSPQSIVVNGHGLYDCSTDYDDAPYYFRCTWQCPAEDLECIDEVRCSHATHPFINDRLLGPYVWEERGSNALYDELVASDPGNYTEEVRAAWDYKCGMDHILPFLYGSPNEQVVDGRPVGATGVHQNQFLNWGRPTGLRCDLPDDPADRDPRCLADGTWPFKGLNKDRVYDHLRNNEDGTYDVKHFDEADLDEHGALCRPTRFYTGDAQPKGNHNPFGLWAQSPLRCDTYPQSSKKAESPAVFEVEAGKTYRLRLVSVASLVYSTLVIEGHSMTVVQVDGAYVEPMETTFLDLWNGQTYSVILRADAEEEVRGDFWIGLSPRHRGYTRIDPGRAILRYVTKDPVTGESTPVANEDARLPGDKSRPVPKYWDAARKGKYPDVVLGKKPIACPVELHSTIHDGDRDLDRCPGFYPNVFDQDISMEQQYGFKSPKGRYPLPVLTRPDEAPVMAVQNMNANGYRDADTYAACASDYGDSEEVQGTYVNAYSYAPWLDPTWDPLHSKFRPGTDIAGQQGELCGVQRWSINNISYPFRYVETMATQGMAADGGGSSSEGSYYKKTLLEHAYDRTLDKLDYVVDVRRPDETPYFSTSPDGYFSSIDPNVLGGRTKLDQGIPPASNELYNIQRFDLGDVFDVVMQNTVYLRFWTNALYGDKHDHRSGSNQHPFHSHGFNFWTLGYGEGNFDLEAWNKEAAVNSESGPRNYEGGIIWHKNMANPSFRNLAVNFAGGWTVLRIKADNPGLWWFHCTTMSHFHMGMGTTFGFGLDRLPKPNPFTLSCDSQDEEHTPVLYNSPIIGPTWSLIEYHDAATDSMLGVVEGSYITLEFEEDGRFDGHSGCNGYSGGYSDPAVKSTFTIEGPLATTLMSCEDAVNQQEMAYQKIFEGDISWSISEDGTSLELTDGENGHVLAQYELYSPPIINTIWQATQLFDESSNGLVNVAEGSSITFKMEVNEKFDGNAGCNNYVGAYDDLTSTSFAIEGSVGSTRMVCEPQVVNDQEAAYLASFKEGNQIDWAVLDDGSLELRDSGKVFAIYEAGPEAPKVQEPLEPESGPIDTTWQATQFFDAPSGELVDVAEGSSITFKMKVNQTFDGNAGCNNYFGTYDDLTSTSFVIDGPLGSTMMFCEPQVVNDQEVAYLANFEDGRRVDWAVLDDGSLELKDADSGDVFATYKASLEAPEKQEPLLKSGAIAFGTSVAALAMVAAIIFV